MQKTKKIIAALLGVAAVLVAIVVLSLVFIVPQIASDAVHERVERIEKRMGLVIEIGDVKTEGLGGVRVQQLSMAGDDGSEPFLTVENVRAQADVGAFLVGDKRVSSLQVDGVHLTFRILADGRAQILDQIKLDSGAPSDHGQSSEPTRSFLDRLPDIDATDITVDIEVAEGGPRVPISKIEMPRASVDISSGELELAALMKLTESGHVPGAEIPAQLETRFIFDEKLAPKSGEAKFDGTLVLAGLPPFPWLRIGTTGFGIDEAGRLYVDDFSLGVYGSEERRILDVERFAARPNTLDIRRVDEFKLVDVVLKGARVQMVRDDRGAFALGDVRNLLAPEAPDIIASSARRFATGLAEGNQLPEPEDDEEPSEKLEVAPKTNGFARHIERWAPDRVDVQDFEIIGAFPNPPDVLRPATSFSMKEGRLALQHDATEGTITFDGGFKALADGEDRGQAAASLELGYRELNLQGTTKLDAVDISWLGLVVGDKLAKLIPGGVLRADLSFEPSGKQAFKASGMVSVEGLEIRSDALALEPIKDVSASYTFDAHFDAHMKPGEPRLLKIPLYDPSDFGADEDPDAELPPPAAGGLVFNSGSFTWNGARGVFRPAFYGFNAPERRPARMDITFEIPRTPVKTLFDAVPTAIQGPAQGTRMAGEFEYKLHVEIPLYRARDMEWESLPLLHDFSVIELPQATDVRRLMEPSTTVTITDSIEEEDDFERTIKLGPPRPMPATWLMKHSGLNLEQIDERRREREWPELPDPYATGISQRMIDRPEIWLTPWALSKAAPKPWNDGDTIERTSERPYGPYVFVPLNHISAYMPLAVMTTEDNSFFKHKGFNTLALKASIERNIEAGGFARGASTIAMQMVKNVFLHREKVLSRKIQEAFLVFLMETAVDVPKARIMEVYLNVIEFGPGIFGIHDAALHYFGKRPDELTLGEVVWFVSIIPNPKRFHFYYERGEITPRWFTRMKRYMQVMHNRERISAEELAAATLEPPEFYKPDPKKNEPVLRPVEEPPQLFLPIDLLGDDEADEAPGQNAPGLTVPSGIDERPGEPAPTPDPTPPSR